MQRLRRFAARRFEGGIQRRQRGDDRDREGVFQHLQRNKLRINAPADERRVFGQVRELRIIQTVHAEDAVDGRSINVIYTTNSVLRVLQKRELKWLNCNFYKRCNICAKKS